MNTIVEHVRSRWSDLDTAMAQEPAILIDYSTSDMATIIVAMHCAVMRGYSTPEALHGYFSDRHYSFDLSVVKLLLAQYLGEDPAEHLWNIDKFGDYRAVTAVGVM